jgi:membrane protease YdiL (CAAX protease family)
LVSWLSKLFWNPAECRLRAPWRLLIQGVLFLVLLILSSGLMSILAGLALLVTGNDGERVIELFESTPFLTVLSALGGLAAILLNTWLAGLWLDHRPFAGFGFHFTRGWWLDFGFGLALGAVLMTLIFLTELAAGWVTASPTWAAANTTPGSLCLALLYGLVVFICTGIEEELLSRGYQLHNLAEGLNFSFLKSRTALLLAYAGSSVVFGLYHLGNPGMTWISTTYLMIAGLLLGLGYVLTGELAIPIGLHITWNFFQGIVFGFPVSGIAPGTALFSLQQAGPDLWTGGGFGPEAGLVGLLAIILGTLLIAGWVRWRQGRLSLYSGVATYVPPSINS